MSLGKVGSFCGCHENGMGCADCQGFGATVMASYPQESLYHGMSGPVPLYPHNPPRGFRGEATRTVEIVWPRSRGMGARWAGQTNYWPTGTHRAYNVSPGLPQQTAGRGLGQISVGGGWTLADVSSLAMIAIAAMTIFGKGMKRR